VFWHGIVFILFMQDPMCTEKNEGKKPGPKGRNYVNRNEKYEVNYENKRKGPGKRFGKGKD